MIDQRIHYENVILPQKLILLVHVFSLVFPPCVFVIILAFVSNPLISIAKASVAFLIATFYNTLQYFLAGGFDWKREKLQIFRVILFWLFGDFLVSLVLYGLWFLVRLIIARLFNIPVTSVLGRLLRGKNKIYSDTQPNETDLVCEECGCKTSAVRPYTFIYGQKGMSTSKSTPGYTIGSTVTTTVTEIKNITESKASYFCNKCICLEADRNTEVIFQIVLIINFILLLVFIPISIIMDNQIFTAPIMVFIFALPIFAVKCIYLRRMEEAPIHAYSDQFNNPKYQNQKGQSDNSVLSQIVDVGEHLAIRIQSPSFPKNGRYVFYTHKEAEKLITLSR